MYNESFGETLKRGYFRIPVAIRIIITINVVVFFLQALGGNSINRALVDWFALWPEFPTALVQPWRVITYMFLHGGVFHLVFNMLWLWWMGRSVEETLGPRTFTMIYFGSGIGGALFDFVFANFMGFNYVIGASGAVFGVMVAFAYMFPRTPIMLFLLPPIEARYVVAGLIALDVLFLGSGDNTARIVHLGGAGVGYLLMNLHYQGYDLSRIPRKAENFWYSLRSVSSQQYNSKQERTSTRRSKHVWSASVSDAEVVEESDQHELDRILEKISKHGYDGLSDQEKKKLFELSNRS
jgi:membrane associated rhomboid family serine protease